MSVQIQKLPSLAELDSLIKSGNLKSVKELIRSVNRNSIPPSELVQYAAIANRVYESKVAYRFLHSVVRESSATRPPTEHEKVEFAEALRGMGLIQESIHLLKEVDETKFPIVHLRLSFCYMTQWRYAEAIPCLTNYIEANKPADYSSTIAQVNLAAAFMCEKRYAEAHQLLRELRKETKSSAHQLLFANCLELTAQLYVLEGQYQLADQTIEEATSIFGENLARYATYMRKWAAVSKSLQTGTVSPELIECQRLAIQDSDWETIRDCDLYIGSLKKDQNLINKVYFGTPYESYRRGVLDLVGDSKRPPQEFVWVADSTKPLERTLDLLSGHIEGQTTALEPGQLVHLLLISLAKDFYRPLSVGSAFSELYPGEHFMQEGSANRVFQIVGRLRDWLKENGEPFQLIETEGGYRLQAAPGVGLRMKLQKPDLSAEALTWEKWKSHLLPETSFTRKDVVQRLNCSPSSASRLIRWSIENQRCETIGNGRQRKYKIAG